MSVEVKCPSDRPIDGESIMPLLKGEKDTRNSTMAWMYNVADNFESSYNADLVLLLLLMILNKIYIFILLNKCCFKC